MKTNVSSLTVLRQRQMASWPCRAWLRVLAGRRAWDDCTALFGSTAALAEKPHVRLLSVYSQCPARAQAWRQGQTLNVCGLVPGASGRALGANDYCWVLEEALLTALLTRALVRLCSQLRDLLIHPSAGPRF